MKPDTYRFLNRAPLLPTQLASSPALQQQLLTVTRRLLLAHLPRALTAAGSAACVHAVQLLLLRLSMSPHQPSLDSLPSHQQPGEDEGECASRDRGDPESNIAGSCGWDQLDHAILLQLQTCIAKLIRRDAAEDAARDACLRPLLQVMLQLASVLVVRVSRVALFAWLRPERLWPLQTSPDISGTWSFGLKRGTGYLTIAVRVG